MSTLSVLLKKCLNTLSLPESEFPQASQMFERPIMDREYFTLLTDQFRSPHLWLSENGNWKLRQVLSNNLITEVH